MELKAGPDSRINQITSQRAQQTETGLTVDRLLSSKECSGSFLATPEHPHFQGHFDGFPVFPAISQVELLRLLLRDSLMVPVRILEIRKAKFLKIICPGDLLHYQIVLESGSDTTSWASWSMVGPKGSVSKGQVRYAIG